MQVNFGRTAADYARYRAGFPALLFDELAARGVAVAGRRVLDLGTGTGTLARGFAARGAEVVALDPAESLLAQGRVLARDYPDTPLDVPHRLGAMLGEKP